jgi:hypothetical protein
MNTGPAFWLILTVGGAVLVGVLLAYGLISSDGAEPDSVSLVSLTSDRPRSCFQINLDQQLLRDVTF